MKCLHKKEAIKITNNPLIYFPIVN